MSYISPHKAIKVSTMSGWMVKVLNLSGIDTSSFSGHSTRCASTSKAKSLEISIANIVKCANWASDSMLIKRYCKEITDDSALNHQKSVLLSFEERTWFFRT